MLIQIRENWKLIKYLLGEPSQKLDGCSQSDHGTLELTISWFLGEPGLNGSGILVWETLKSAVS